VLTINIYVFPFEGGQPPQQPPSYLVDSINYTTCYTNEKREITNEEHPHFPKITFCNAIKNMEGGFMGNININQLLDMFQKMCMSDLLNKYEDILKNNSYNIHKDDSPFIHDEQQELIYKYGYEMPIGDERRHRIDVRTLIRSNQILPPPHHAQP